MSKFELNPGAAPVAANQEPDRVRIGAVSLFALVVVICLAVLSVLAVSTSTASLTMSERQATAMQELYLDEIAAQEFLAQVDDLLAEARHAESGHFLADEDEGKIEIVRDERGNVVYDEYGYQVVAEKESDKHQAGSRALTSIEASLADLCAQARAAVQGEVEVTAEVHNGKVAAEFTCQNGRKLNIVIAVRNNGTYRIDRWRMSAVQNEEPVEGQFFIFE